MWGAALQMKGTKVAVRTRSWARLKINEKNASESTVRRGSWVNADKWISDVEVQLPFACKWNTIVSALQEVPWFFPKVNSSSNLEKKKKWEISSLKDRHAACSTCCMLAAQPPSSIGLELMQQRKSSPDRCRVSCSEPFCCRNVVLLVMLTLSSGVETGTFTAASFYRHHVIGNFMWKIYLVPWWKK